MKTYTAQELNEAVKAAKTVEITRSVTFYSPGTFVSEQNSYETSKKSIDEIIKEAVEKAKSIVQRYNAFPYGFRVEGEKGMFFLPHCKKLHRSEIPDTKENKILLSNMEINGWDYVVQTTEGWQITQPFTADDKLLSK